MGSRTTARTSQPLPMPFSYLAAMWCAVRDVVRVSWRAGRYSQFRPRAARPYANGTLRRMLGKPRAGRSFAERLIPFDAGIFPSLML